MASFRGLLTPKRSFLSSPFPFERIWRFHAEDKSLTETRDSDVLMQWKEHTFWMWAAKLWLPIVSVASVLIGWRHPLSLAIDFALLLFTTKPSQHSVYLFIEQWQNPSVWRQGLDRTKVFSTKKVEFQDYGLLSLAWVEFGNKEATLIGIFGGWWVLDCSPCSKHASLLGSSSMASYLRW
ncbi:hypothetical protein EJ110_NYTH57801 [Nymphaea thermarum]|nr:hypothetical protein EJ110_NYTH57801 [Nymphaea thermarum]